MRENMGLYRGKRKDNGEWVEGFLFKTREHTYIAYAEQYDDDLFLSAKNIFIEVDPETVGECVNIPDENGKMIFEGDIVKNEYEKGKYQYFKVFYCNRLYCWQVANKYGMLAKLYNLMGKVEVIGNIHDNPELLE